MHTLNSEADRVYFKVYFDEAGALVISPRDTVERMALKHLQYEVKEHGLERMIVIDTDLPIRLGAQ